LISFPLTTFQSYVIVGLADVLYVSYFGRVPSISLDTLTQSLNTMVFRNHSDMVQSNSVSSGDMLRLEERWAIPQLSTATASPSHCRTSDHASRRSSIYVPNTRAHTPDNASLWEDPQERKVLLRRKQYDDSQLLVVWLVPCREAPGRVLQT